MPDYYVATDEVYPVYFLYKDRKHWTQKITISKKLAARLNKAEKEYYFVQEKIEAALNRG